MHGEPQDPSHPDRDSDLHPDLRAWKDSIPVVSAAEEAEAVRVAKESAEKNREFLGRIQKAQHEYFNIYEKHPIIWKLPFVERLNYLLTLLEGKGITFTEPEKIILRTTLQNSTVKMKTLSPDYVDDPSKPDPLKGSSSSSKKE